ncbi:MAG TPA: response regulator [Verrucomicrobiae bacterium]|nr:response regulator [Verrucomicrobiae bacterium]
MSEHLILMAEDDADDRLLVQDAFAECGASDTVRFVADGEELVDYLLRRGKYEKASASPRPDLILLDLNMPRKDGREALKEIRSHQELRRVPVIVFTTSRADTDIDKVYELGANSFVTKPAGFDQLVTTVTKLTGYWFGTVELPALRNPAA